MWQRMLQVGGNESILTLEDSTPYNNVSLVPVEIGKRYLIILADIYGINQSSFSGGNIIDKQISGYSAERSTERANSTVLIVEATSTTFSWTVQGGCGALVVKL